MSKKKETIWQLLKRLDEEAAQFNSHLSEANRYYDSTARTTRALLASHERKMQKHLGKLKDAIVELVKKVDHHQAKNKKRKK